MSRTLIYIIAGSIMLAAFLINYRGIIVSSRGQPAVITAIVGLLVTAVIASAPSVNSSNFSPFFPQGLLPIGVSAALILCSYLRYDDVANVPQEVQHHDGD